MAKGGRGVPSLSLLNGACFPCQLLTFLCHDSPPPAPARIMMSTCRLGCFLGGGGGGKGGNCFQKMNDANDGFIV